MPKPIKGLKLLPPPRHEVPGAPMLWRGVAPRLVSPVALWAAGVLVVACDQPTEETT